MKEEIIRQLQQHGEVMTLVQERLSDSIAELAAKIVDALDKGNKVLVMGNGGSAADAQHFVAEIIGRFKKERRALPAIALTTDTSILTAIGNDYGFDLVFRRQVEGLAAAGDVVVGISTSGNSKNVMEALQLANELNCFTVGLLGRDGGSIKDLAHLSLVIPSNDTPRIQEGHITIIHIVCDLIERALFP